VSVRLWALLLVASAVTIMVGLALLLALPTGGVLVFGGAGAFAVLVMGA
jgi:hypothetical protein